MAPVCNWLTLWVMCSLQVGFIAIRELAVLLRNALAAKTQDAHKEVYCWQVTTNGLGSTPIQSHAYKHTPYYMLCNPPARSDNPPTRTLAHIQG